MMAGIAHNKVGFVRLSTVHDLDQFFLKLIHSFA